jgi:hypothetical protein
MSIPFLFVFLFFLPLHLLGFCVYWFCVISGALEKLGRFFSSFFPIFSCGLDGWMHHGLKHTVWAVNGNWKGLRIDCQPTVKWLSSRSWLGLGAEWAIVIGRITTTLNYASHSSKNCVYFPLSLQHQLTRNMFPLSFILRLWSIAPSHPTWRLRKRHRSLASGRTSGPTPSTDSGSLQKPNSTR